MVDANDALTYSPETSRMIWIDCEMTGLDIFHDELCEVSVVPTDFELNVLDKGIDLVIKPSEAAVAHMDDFVRAMHTRSGLIKELARRWYPAVYENRPPKNGGHRAWADIVESLDELRYYRAAIMAPEPGPDTVQSKRIAEQIVATSVMNEAE